jgi:hypothetical protein
MRGDVKADKILPNEHNNSVNLHSYDKETEAIKILDALSIKTKLKNEEESCNLKDSCYTAKYKMGPCPCELYR